ncbi:MAG TPA: FAD-dependent oxidoreductase [Steroidobacter sp.]|uniref:flavin monoamine oxidase family protein n=1 Tax=Steroidobacter sp. TaxID=1978227 RepID=UPI002ED9E6E7
MDQPVSRRTFLHMVGAVGGSTAIYQVALGMGLMPEIRHVQRPDIAPLARGQRKSVVILGAGIAGLTAAYELDRKGYEVQVLEASHRAGGRNFTVRGGDLIDEAGQPQICRFDPEPHLYFNAGPARIPGHHTALLGYCRELGVELAPFINDNRNAWVQDDAMFGGRPIRNREYIADTRGFIAELMVKGLDAAQLDEPLTQADYAQLLEYLRQFGELDAEFKYRGSTRAGLVAHDYTQPEQRKQPLDFRQLLQSRFMYLMSFGEGDDQSAMMMEPVGGMDRIVTAFMSRVGHRVRTHAPVQAIRLQEKGVEVAYRHKGQERIVRADFCLNSIPTQLLAGIEHNFPPDYAGVFSAIPRGKLFKIGFQAKERFWEREGIYGGISWTMQDIMQVWYPAHGIHRPKGVLLGAYTFSEDAGEKFAGLTHQQRLDLAIQQGEKIHPGYRGYIENGVSICWHRMNHMLGCASQWSEPLRTQYFKRLQQPVGHHYMIGDQASYHPGWQEGAIHSAFHALTDIDQRVRNVALVAA